jgi:HemY protein
MIRLVIYLIGVAALATGLSWLADRPGSLMLTWQGYEVETSVFRAAVILAVLIGFGLLAWSMLRHIWTSPAALGRFLTRRRQERGLDALSSGMIAVGAGDRNLATRYALQARRSLPNEPLTHLLRAQAAQLSGDRATSRRIFEAMLGSPDTEQLGLRGLFLEAERTGEPIAARQFAERAMKLNPKLEWPVDALFELQCMASDWAGALETLGIARRHNHIDRTMADRRRAVLLTTQAQDLEDGNGESALALALEAHDLAPDLIPAAAIAGRLLASRGSTAKAARVIEKTWKRAPHPDLAAAYAYARPGDSPRDRVERVRLLARSTPHSIEGPIALANTAIDARDWSTARTALAPLLDTRLTQRVCTLMARIEGDEKGDAGRVREWLARAVNAPRDPAWTADGVVSDRWAAISPVTGALDAFQWKVPVESAEKPDQALLAAKLEELVALGVAPDAIEAKPVASEPVLRAPASPAPDKTTAPAETAVAENADLLAEAVKTPENPVSVAASDKPTAKPEVTASSNAPGGKETSSSQAPVSAGSSPKQTTGAPSTKPPQPQTSSAAPKTTPMARAAAAKPDDQRMFVSPRAPDDPGPDDVEERFAASYLTPAAKRPL